MGLKFNCSNSVCRARIEVDDALAGKEISCPACGSTLHVPASHDIRFNCRTADCGQHLVVDVSAAGRAVKCPACGRPQRVPGDPPKALVPQRESTQTKDCGTASKQIGASKPLRRFDCEEQLMAWFFAAALLGLLGFGLAKVSTLWMQPGFPPGEDAVLQLPLNTVLVGLGVIECAVAGLCAWVASPRLAALVLLWYAVNWWVYRVGQMWLGQQEPLPALGAAGDLVGISAIATDRMMMGFSVIMAVGAAVIVSRQGRLAREIETEDAASRRRT